MKRIQVVIIPILWCLLLCSQGLRAQDPLSRFRGMGSGGAGGGDSLVHRKDDTITINFRYLDSSRYQKMDSSVYDFSKKVPQPPTWINLGNTGSPARNLVFSPRMISGWDPGFHAYDLYVFKVEDTRFYHTTKPYTELGYLIGSKSEQLIDVQHTQNVRPNWNIGFEYRLINSVGAFQSQNTNHNNIRVFSWYQSKNKRYQNFFIFLRNKIAASDNGGIQNHTDLDSISYSNQAILPVWLGNNAQRASSSFFGSAITTGTHYSTTTFLMRQQYDLGQKDSIVTDTSVIPLFYPRVRLEHTLSYSTYAYQYTDFGSEGNNTLDSFYYAAKMGITGLSPYDSFFRRDRWKDFSNDFSIYTFPDSKNPQQFFKVGLNFQLLKGGFDSASLASGSTIYTYDRVNNQNVFAHGEYRNKTRNQKWDVEAFGKLYLNGLNAGDYNAYISLRRLLSKNVGYLQLGFQNSNSTPAFTFDRASGFYTDTVRNKSFQKENTTNLFASVEIPRLRLLLKGSYYLMSNYAYLQDYFKDNQESTLFNLLQVSVKKEFVIGKSWRWRTLLVVQQVAGSSPVHVPFLVFHNLFGYEGNLGFHNLLLDVGTEIRYISGYQADGYSPVAGQFFSQADTTIRQRLPDINLFMHLRIRSFTAYVRAENLNSMKFSPRGFGFYGNNFVAPDYPSPGLLIRFGFFWGFVN